MDIVFDNTGGEIADAVCGHMTLFGRVVFDHTERFDAAAGRLAEMLSEGSLLHAEDVETDIRRAPEALVDVYSGRNRGRKLIRLL